jgi:hypothetical protein
MTDTTIARVEALALEDGQPLIQASGLVVERRPDHPIDDSEYDRDFRPRANAATDIFEPHAYDDIDIDELNDLLADAAVPVVPPAPPALDVQGAIHDNDAEDEEPPDNHEQPLLEITDDEHENELETIYESEHEQEDEDDAPEIGALAVPEIGAQNDQEIGAHIDDVTHEGNAIVFGAQEEPQPPRYNLRGRALATNELVAREAARTPRYNLRDQRSQPDRLRDAMDDPHDSKSYHAPVQLMQQGIDAQCRYIFGWVMNQMTAKAGLAKHGEFAEEALLKEFMQHRDLDVYEILDPLTLTPEQKKAALRAINLLKEKRNGDLKGRTVADGRKQRPLYSRAETASPTVSTIALMLTIMIDAFERRDVATADVAGAYLNAQMDDFVLIKFTGESVDILLSMEPAYTKFVTYEKGVKTLYGRLKKALYGCVKSALLWYKLLQGTLKTMGFTINPYDPCVANCMIEGSQCTIAWYVDDTKISHVNPEVVTRVIETLEGHFGKMTVTRGREHVFLGMKIKYNENQTATITMKQYLEEALAECNMDINYEAATPAKRSLFDLDEQSARLTMQEAEIFHSISAKLLYVAIRGRMDILLPVGFLGTRVSKCTKDDQDKLRRILEYIKGTMDEEYTIGADTLHDLRTWVDASFAVHPDMRSHTGGMISYGRGGIACKSTKQKSTMRSSTHAEMVGVSDYLPTTIWVTHFMTAQGYPPKTNVLEQDNESAIKLEVNGRTSAGAKSRHLNIRYFWIKENLDDFKIKVRHCRTLKMLADFFTKPLQGALFRIFRDIILGKNRIISLDSIPDLLVEERVEEGLQDGPGTDVKNKNKSIIDADGFILVKGRKKHTEGYAQNAVAAERNSHDEKSKIVSRSLS